MSKFGTSVVTEQGKALLFGDEKIIYTKAVLFSQDLSKTSVEDMRKLTSLSGKLFETPIGINKRGAGTVNVEASFSNKDLTDDIDFNSVGWFAKPDGGQEILVSVSPVNGTQTLGAMTPGQQATDAIDLVLATAVGDSSKVDVVIDPAGQVTAAKLNSIVENLKADYSKQGDDLTSKIEANKEATDKAIADNKASTDSALKSATDKLTKTISDNQASTNAAIDKAKSDADSKISSLTDTVTANKNATDKAIASTNATVASNKTDTDKKIADVSSTVSANKTATDKAISDANSAITANKKDADTKISNLNSTVANNKTATDKAISDTNATVAANKKSTDSAIATKANASDVYTKKQVDGAFATRDNSISTKADKSSTYTKSEVDTKVKSASDAAANAQSSANKAQTTANNALPKAGGDMNKNATINFKGNTTTTAAKDGNIGGIKWSAASDYVEVFGDNDANDNLDLAINLTDDSSNHISFRWNGAEKAGINAAGVYTGTVDWSHINGKPDVATNSAVNAKANSSDVYTKAQVDSKTTTLQNNINQKLDKNVQIGSVNLLQGSKGPFKPNGSKLDNYVVYTNTKIYMEKGNVYSVWGETNGIFSGTHNTGTSTKNVVLWIVGNNVNSIISSTTTGTTGNSFTWNNPTAWYNLRVNSYVTDNSIQASNIKIVKGSKITPDWSPAPEDVESDIQSAKDKATDVQNTLQSRLDSTNKNVTTAQSTANTANSTANAAKSAAATAQSTANTANSTANTAKTNAATAQSTANSATTKANNAQTTANNALPKAGGTMNSGAFINWNSSIANGSTGQIGGLKWSGATDGVEIIADQNGKDNVDLAFNLTDDGSNHFSFRNKGSEVAAIQSNGHFTGTVDWSKINGKPTDIGSASTINSLKTQVNNVVSQVNNLDPNRWRQKGEVVDLNTFWDTGYYTLMNSNNKNLPSWIKDRRGSLIVLSYDGNSKTQIFISCLNSQIAYRTTVGSSRSSSWYRLATNSDIDNLQNQINQIKSTVPVVQKFTDENQAKTWSNAGGSQVRIAIID